MNSAEFQLQGVGDPRLALLATSALPAWLWSADGTRILWANPVGARLFGAANGTALAKKIFGPAEPHRRQVAQLAGRLPANGAIRMERLRGFGARLGLLATCGCARLDFADGSHGILVKGTEAVSPALPLIEKLQRLVEDMDTPMAAFTRDGMFVGTSEAAARPCSVFIISMMPGLRLPATKRWAHGRAETSVGNGRLILQRVGTASDIGLIALLTPEAKLEVPAEPVVPSPATVAEPIVDEMVTDKLPVAAESSIAPASPVEAAIEPLTPDYEAPELSGEAPAEFALADEVPEHVEIKEHAELHEPLESHAPAEAHDPAIESAVQIVTEHASHEHAAHVPEPHEHAPQEPVQEPPVVQKPAAQELIAQEHAPEEHAPQEPLAHEHAPHENIHQEHATHAPEPTEPHPHEAPPHEVLASHINAVEALLAAAATAGVAGAVHVSAGHHHEPSPPVEAVADVHTEPAHEPASLPAAEIAAEHMPSHEAVIAPVAVERPVEVTDAPHDEAPHEQARHHDEPSHHAAPHHEEALHEEPPEEPQRHEEPPHREVSHDPPAPATRHAPLRFVWQMDAAGHFVLGKDEFTHLIGARTAAGFGRLWSEIAETFDLDPEGRVLKAMATHDTWSGITLDWPVDGGDRLPVELSGLPVFDRARNFVGFRGFGVCRDVDGLTRLAALRRHELFSDPPPLKSLSSDVVHTETVHSENVQPDAAPSESLHNDAVHPEAIHSDHVHAEAGHLSAADLPAVDLPPPDPAEIKPPTSEVHTPATPEADLPVEPLAEPPHETPPEKIDPPVALITENSHQNILEAPVEPPKNVLPFRPINEPKAPVLTPGENSAFNEIARQLSARLEHENGKSENKASESKASENKSSENKSSENKSSENEPAESKPENLTAAIGTSAPSDEVETVAAPPAAPEKPSHPAEATGWLTHAEQAPRGESRRDKMLLDLVPAGVLVYRLDRLLYANRTFLERMGYASLRALEDAGGLDALYVEPGVSNASSTSDTGTPVTISASQAAPGHTSSSATDANLFTISWDDDSALALILSNAVVTPHVPVEAAVALVPVVTEAPVSETHLVNEAHLVSEAPAISEPPAAGQASAEDLGAILDTTAEGIVMFDAEGNIHACNRSGEALFGYDGAEITQRNLGDLFAPESHQIVLDYLESIKGAGVASFEAGRDVLGRVSKGGFIPLSMTIGRTRPDGPNFFAVFRDLSPSQKSENELQQAQRLAERAANAKADMLARISHEVRTPLNAIIGFSEVMIGERFGALGNERYGEYMKDIRASGQRVIAIIDDLLDLSRIETGKLDLAFANQNLNDLVENCVGVMQPQANRERIIIRTSLAHMLPPVVADARALRQIALNLIGNSIHLANAGGQVIVSTALSDFGEVVLRVRDTGHGLNDNEVAAAMEPFRTPAPSDQASDGSGVSLSLTKALVEANRAKFNIKTGPHSGTLIEVVFAHAVARA